MGTCPAPSWLPDRLQWPGAGRSVGLLGRSYRERRLVRAELRRHPVRRGVLELRLEPGDGRRRPGGALEPALREGDPARLRAAGARGAGERRLPRDAALRAADARRAADALSRHLADLAPGGDRAGPAPRLVVSGGADRIRAPGDGRGDPQPRRRPVSRLPRQLRGAGGLLPGAGDLDFAAPREPAGAGVVHDRPRRLRDGNRGLVRGPRGLPPGERDAAARGLARAGVDRVLPAPGRGLLRPAAAPGRGTGHRGAD